MQKTLDRILLIEDSKTINAARTSATERAEKINSIASIFSFENYQEFENRTRNIDKMVEVAMLKIPSIKKLSQNVELSAIKVPPQITEAKTILEYLIRKFGNGVFTHLAYIPLSGKWEPDQDSLEAYANSQRVYAETEKEIEFYQASMALCEFLNKNKLGFGSYEKGAFHNLLNEWSISGNCWIPSIRFIKS